MRGRIGFWVERVIYVEVGNLERVGVFVVVFRVNDGVFRKLGLYYEMFVN